MKKLFLYLSSVFLVSAFSTAMAQMPIDQNKVKEIILQEAQKQGLSQLPDVMAAIRTAQEAVIVRAWERSVLASQPVTQDLKNQIYKELSVTLGDAEYVIFQVFLDNEQAADDLRKAMSLNPKWEDINIASIVTENVKFSKNKPEWVNLSMIVPEFRASVKAMKVGETINKPIRVNSGWHVIGLMQKRPLVMPSAEAMDKDLVTLAERRILTQKLQNLLPQ